MAKKATSKTRKGSPRKPARTAARRTATRRTGTRLAARAIDAKPAIRNLDAEFARAAKAKDAAALVRAFYTSDAVLMPPNHAAVSGRGAIQEFLQNLMDGGLDGIELETTVTASAGDLAYGRGRYTLSMSPAGGEPIEDVGKYVVVYRRQPNGSWQAVADIFNSDK